METFWQRQYEIVVGESECEWFKLTEIFPYCARRKCTDTMQPALEAGCEIRTKKLLRNFIIKQRRGNNAAIKIFQRKMFVGRVQIFRVQPHSHQHHRRVQDFLKQ